MNSARWYCAAVAVAAIVASSAMAEDEFVIKGDAEKGAAAYKTYCAMCHGDTGKGDGLASAALTPKPRNFTDKEVMAEISDKEIFTAIKDGGPAVGKSPLMVAWGAVLGNDQNIHDVAAFVRSLAK